MFEKSEIVKEISLRDLEQRMEFSCCGGGGGGGGDGEGGGGSIPPRDGECSGEPYYCNTQ